MNIVAKLIMVIIEEQERELSIHQILDAMSTVETDFLNQTIPYTRQNSSRLLSFLYEGNFTNKP